MSPRWSVLLLAAASAFAGEYKASDDGRVVYFTGTPVGDPVPSRLWRWANGNILTLLDDYAPNQNPAHVRIQRLTPDGRFALVSSFRYLGDFVPYYRWQIYLDGASRPLLEITDAAYVSLSPNGRWLAIFRRQAGRAVELFELTAAGLRSVAVWPDPRPDGLLGPIFDFPSLVSDEAQVRVPCPASTAPCLWDSRTGSSQPQTVPFDGTARAHYQWRERLPGPRNFLFDASGAELPVICDSRSVAVAATDPTGRRAHLRCGQRHLLYDADTNRVSTLPTDPSLNSTLTATLIRTSATQFLWQPLGGPSPEPLDRFDTIPLLSATSPNGLFAISSPPDFTLEWGGQTLSWIRGSLGYHYAFLPADIVPGAVDFFRLNSFTRPWLNAQRDRIVAREALAAVPINAADPRLLFIHEDYSGLITRDAPARPGERVHLYITGIDPAKFDGEITVNILPSIDARHPTVVLRGTSLAPTSYSRSLLLLTAEVPLNFDTSLTPTQTLTLRLSLRRTDGYELTAYSPVLFSVQPN